MLDLTRLASSCRFATEPGRRGRGRVLGQMTGKVVLPSTMVRPGLPDWAVFGDGAHRGNLISSIFLDEKDLEAHNVRLNEKYKLMESEQRADLFACDDASTLVVAFGTPARMAKGAVETLRKEGLPVGLFRPLTLWPFPIASLGSSAEGDEDPRRRGEQRAARGRASPRPLESRLAAPR